MRRLIPPAQTSARTGLSDRQHRRLEEVGKFPARVRLSDGRNGHVEDEVDQWIEERIAERNAATPARWVPKNGAQHAGQPGEDPPAAPLEPPAPLERARGRPPPGI